MDWSDIINLLIGFVFLAVSATTIIGLFNAIITKQLRIVFFKRLKPDALIIYQEKPRAFIGFFIIYTLLAILFAFFGILLVLTALWII